MIVPVYTIKSNESTILNKIQWFDPFEAVTHFLRMDFPIIIILVRPFLVRPFSFFWESIKILNFPIIFLMKILLSNRISFMNMQIR